MAQTRKITIGILAHVDAGKTTLSEAILYKTGELRKIGRVDHGDSFLDDNEIERNRGITIFSRQARFTVTSGSGSESGARESGSAGADQVTEFTMIDTPGHVDFAAEMERSLSVIDYALLVVSGSEGVQAHTRTLYRMLSDRGIPVFVFVNKMDIAVRSREDILDELSAELGCGAADFTGAFAGSRPQDTGKYIDDITLHSSGLAELVLEHELEAEETGGNGGSGGTGANGVNDASGESGASGGSSANGVWMPADAEVAEAVRRCEIVPCIFGSALKLEGIEGLIEVLGRFTLMPSYGDEPAARVYKTSYADDGSRLTFVKVTGGTLRVRDTIAVRREESGSTASGGIQRETYDNSASKAKINQIRLYSGSRYVTADEAPAGSVCALTGFSDTVPGDALGAEMPEGESVIKPFMVYTVCGPDGMDPYLVMKDMQALEKEDPALTVRWRPESGETEIRLMGQVQLEVLTAVIRERFGYDVTFGSGKVLYLETVSDTFEGVGHFEPLRHYAEVHLIIEPGERGSGIVISSITPEDELARNWQRLIVTHIEEKEHTGVLTGAPLTDVRITLAAGRAHDKHTSGGDFREATYRAIRNALMQARAAGAALLLEPWLEYEMELPSQNVGRAMTDIRQMGGTQEGLEQSGDTSRIRGRVPASKIAGYQQTLTSYTSGIGRLSCTPAGYAECHDTEAVIEESGYDPERDIDNPADSVFVSHGGSDIVKWDEVPQHMHLGSVLRRRRRTGSSDGNSSAGYTGSYDAGADDGAPYSPYHDTYVRTSALPSSEARKRQLAAEKELRMIFERTYGPAKSGVRREARESRFGSEYDAPEKTAEQKAADEMRNQQIREKHEKKKTAASEQESAVVLIDGYNLIHWDEYLRELADKDMGAARDQLIERLVNYAAYTGTETIVVFDAYNVSGSEGREEDHLGVRVIYTAEDEPADIRIGLITNTMKNRSMYVVSSDLLVQQDSFEHGALRISSAEFMRLLAHTEEEIRSALR